ncbi:hypothetical protein M3I54_41635 [Paraburkholderia sp. CNPSo 3274]|uniref:hypothetical protein n=1 Tax=Paraburkholderia sp. CNPSo 3274 TaxID=2940932 RepID=UPI0020B6C38F|nr:hypothetical protein [Paraburkholderia sp. CNPSo 3274]MCP3713292.1 hypothetical protein [Paraburkholderia sp. CNPSo 3274]
MGGDFDIVQSRDAIRQKAFELADSGMLEGWEAVRRTLRACFEIESVEDVLGSPFCRLDLDLRCRAGRVGGVRGHIGPGLAAERDGADRGAHPARGGTPAAASSPTAQRRRCHERTMGHPARPPGLAGNISMLLDEDRECTAIQLAQQLDASPRDVRRALREMLVSGEVYVARRAPRTAGGRTARIFARTPHDPGGENAASGATSCWPRVDPVVLRAMDALARHA